MSRPHARPTGSAEVPTYAGLPPVMAAGDIADYFGVSVSLVDQWRRKPAWPEPFVELRAGRLWRTVDIIEWAKVHERKRAEGPREAHDTRPPSAKRRASKRSTKRPSRT